VRLTARNRQGFVKGGYIAALVTSPVTTESAMLAGGGQKLEVGRHADQDPQGEGEPVPQPPDPTAQLELLLPMAAH
jgi:hypothetical protein